MLFNLRCHSCQYVTFIGKCGTTYTSPNDLIWLTNNAADCADNIPCVHNILAPANLIVSLNFTRLSGLGYSELKDGRSTYDLIDGQSNCQPRIEVRAVCKSSMAMKYQCFLMYFYHILSHSEIYIRMYIRLCCFFILSDLYVSCCSFVFD